jgi:hypothetical protein
MRNLKALYNRIKTGNTLHAYQVLIQTEIIVNANNKTHAKNQVLDARELIAELLRRNDFMARELNIRVKSL